MLMMQPAATIYEIAVERLTTIQRLKLGPNLGVEAAHDAAAFTNQV